jgi:hypothetical protein
MAYRPVLMLVAEGVVIDNESNLLSVFNVLEEITPFGFPFLIQRLATVTTTEKDPEDASIPPNCSVQFLLDQDVLLDTPANINFQDRPRNRFKLTVGGLVIPRPGRLTVRLVVAGAILQSYAITIRPAVNPPAAAGGQAPPAQNA